MITKKDMEVKEKLPTKEERKKEQEQRDKDNADIKALKELLMEFVNEKILPLDIPISTVEEVLTSMVKPLLTIHKAKSRQFANYLKAKKELEMTPINKLEYVE